MGMVIVTLACSSSITATLLVFVSAENSVFLPVIQVAFIVQIRSLFRAIKFSIRLDLLRYIGGRSIFTISKWLVIRVIAWLVVVSSWFLAMGRWFPIVFLIVSLGLFRVIVSLRLKGVLNRVGTLECFILRVVSLLRPLLILMLLVSPVVAFVSGSMVILRGVCGLTYGGLWPTLWSSNAIAARWLWAAASYRGVVLLCRLIFYTFTNITFFWHHNLMGTNSISFQYRIENLVPKYFLKITGSFILLINIIFPIFLYSTAVCLGIVEVDRFVIMLLVPFIGYTTLTRYLQILRLV